MKKMMTFAALALASFVMVGCSGTESVANNFVDALLENDADTLKELAPENTLPGYKALAKSIEDGDAEFAKYKLENFEVTRVIENEDYARVYYTTTVPYKFTIANPTGDIWVIEKLRNGFSPVSVGEFKGKVAEAYFDGSDAEIHGEDAFEGFKCASEGADALYDYMVEINDAIFEANDKDPKELSDSEVEKLKNEARELSIAFTQYLTGLCDKYKFESVDDLLDSVEFIHEEEYKGECYTSYITITPPEVGFIEFAKDKDGEWKIHSFSL